MRSALPLSCLLVVAGVAQCAPDAELAKIRERYRANLGTAPGWAADRVANQQPDGSWKDVDYSDQDRSSWGPMRHLGNLRAIAAISPATDAATRALNRGLDYWREHDFKCPNWWYNEIGAPMSVGDTAMLAQGRLTPENFRYITETVMPRAKIGMTGQNRAWVAGITFVRALLTDQVALAKEAMAVISEEVRITEKEGLQPDWSFHQHGPQQQFGNYGLAFAGEMTQWADLLRDTSLAFSPEQIELLRNYLLEGENWVCWRG